MRILRVLVVLLLLTLLSESAYSFSTVPTLLAAVAIASIAFIVQLHLRAPPTYTPEPGSLSDQVILITGGTSGLGLESAKRLAVSGARIILTARSNDKGKEAVNEVQQYLQKRGITNEKVSYKTLQLDDLSAIRASVNSWTDIETVDVLMNNAGVACIIEREITVDGFERQIQTNHLGHFLLTALLTPRFSAKARVINVSSDAYMMSILSGGLDFNDLWKAEKLYFSWKSYSQSKLANIFFTQELQRRVDQAGLDWTAVAVHPGAVFTGIIRHFYLGINNYERLKAGEDVGILMKVWLFFLKAVTKTSEQGASTQVWLASAAEGDVGKLKGSYVSDYQVRNLWRFAEDKDAAARLWMESEDRAGARFHF